MTSKNEHTGDKLQTKPASEEYRENYDRIFGKKPPDAEKSRSTKMRELGFKRRKKGWTKEEDVE